MKGSKIIVLLLLVLGLFTVPASAQSLNLYYNMSNSFQDLSGNSFDGTANGGVTSGGISGRFGQATSFDGGDDYVDTNYNVMNQMEASKDAISFSFLINFTTTSQQAVWGAYDTDDTGEDLIIFRVNNENTGGVSFLTRGMGGGATAKVSSNRTDLNDGEMYHVTAVLRSIGEGTDEKKMEVWIDGENVTSYTNSPDNPPINYTENYDETLALGGRKDGDGSVASNFEGGVDEFKIYRGGGGLNETQIKSLNSSNTLQTSSSSGNTAPSVSNPVPNDGSKGVVSDTDLSVDVSDSDGDSIDVEFLWENGTSIETVSGVSSGSTVSTSSLNLQNDTTYNWQVETTDGQDTTFAGNYSFTTEVSSVQSESPIAEYYFNESSTPLIDYASSYDGAWQGTVSSVSGITKAQGNWFDGEAYDLTDGWVDVDAQSSAWETDSTNTVCTWVKFDSDTSSQQVFVHSRDTADSVDQWILYYNDGTSLRYLTKEGYEGNADQSWSPSTGEWYHVCGVQNESDVELYVDGSSFANDSATSSTAKEASDSSLGAYFDGSNNADIYQDETKIYDVALNSDQISKLYSENSLGGSTGSGSSELSGSLSVSQTFNTSSVNVGDIFEVSSTVSCSGGNCSDESTDLRTELFSLSGKGTQKLGDGGAWTWFNDPRAYRYSGQEDKTYYGFIDSGGDVHIKSYNHETGEIKKSPVLRSFSDPDDHNNPSIIALDDGTLLTAYTNHGDSNIYIRKSSNPEDVSSWEAEQTPTSGSITYSNTMQLDNGDIYVFFRDGGSGAGDQFYLKSTDGGDSWTRNRLTDWPSSQNPYQQYVKNGNEIHVTFSQSEDSPTGLSTKVRQDVWYAYFDGSTWRTHSGSVSLPLTKSNSELVYQTPDSPDNRSTWVWDIQVNSQGEPRIAYADELGTGNHLYRQARWTGSSWNLVDITDSDASGLYSTQEFYSPGVYQSYNDPDEVYASTNFTGTLQIQKYDYNGSGFEFSKNITDGQVDSFRPATVRNNENRSVNDVIDVLFMRGGYTDFKTWSSDIYGYLRNFSSVENCSSNPVCLEFGTNPRVENLTLEDGQSTTYSWELKGNEEGLLPIRTSSEVQGSVNQIEGSDRDSIDIQSAVDTNPPTSSDNWSASGFVDKSEAVVEISATDDDSGVGNISYQVNGGGYTTDAGSSTTVTITSEGNNTLEYYATDNAGNQESVNTEYVALAGDKNILSLDSPANGAEFNDDETVSIEYSGDFNNSGTYSLQVDGTDVESTQVDSTTSFSSTYSDTFTPGNYTFQAVFNSDSGLTESTETRAFEVLNASTTKKILDNDSSTGNFYVSSGGSPVEYSNGFAPEDNETVEWTVNATGGEGNSFEFFAFGNSTGSQVDQENSSMFTVSVNGSSTDSNNAPDASFSFSPSSPVDGESITFDGSGSSDSDGSIASYSWDFGDGSTGSGETASHTYGSSGDYTVELTVTDNDGATTSVTGTVSVESSSDGGGGGSGGGDDGTTDNTTDDSTSVGLGGSKAQILAPSLKARYGTDYFVVDSGTESTVTIAGLEKTIGVTYVESSEQATITVDGSTQNVSEGEFIEEGDPLREFVTAEDIIQTSSEGAGKVVFTRRGASDSNSVPIVHNLSIGENVSLDVQYRRTGGNDWITERTYSSSTGFEGLFTENISVSQGIFETRLVLSNSTDNVTSAPVGFLVGEVPDIEVTRPDQGEVFVRQPAPRVRLPLEYSSTTVNDTLYDHYYEDSSGERYTDTQVLSTESSDDFTLFDATEIVNQLPWVGVFGDQETPFFDFFGITDGSTFNQSLSVIVPGQEGEYTAYVNATDNNSLVNFSATSVGKTATLRITSSTNESVISDREDQTTEFTNQGVDSKASTDNDTEITQDFNNFSSGNETFKKPYFISYTPGDNATVTLQDLSNSSVDFAFDLSHEGDALLNKSIIIEENGSQVTELGLESGKSDYSFSVTPSMLTGTDTWNETSYEWYAVFKDGSEIVYNTKENMTDGTRTFQVEKQSIENKLTGNFWNDVAVVFNPANYSQIVQYFVSILLILVPGVLLRDYEKVAVGSMVTVLVGTVLAGWMPTIIGLIIFIGFLLLIADRAGRVIG